MYNAAVAPKHHPHANVQLPPIRSTNTTHTPTHQAAASNLAQSHRAAADAELTLISTFNQEIRSTALLKILIQTTTATN